MKVYLSPPWKLKHSPEPLPDENLKSYGDRLLWHQLGLQLHALTKYMLTEDEFDATVLHYFPAAVAQNVKHYRSYFNGIHKSMGFRDQSKMPIAVEFLNA